MVFCFISPAAVATCENSFADIVNVFGTGHPPGTIDQALAKHKIMIFGPEPSDEELMECAMRISLNPASYGRLTGETWTAAANSEFPHMSGIRFWATREDVVEQFESIGLLRSLLELPGVLYFETLDTIAPEVYSPQAWMSAISTATVGLSAIDPTLGAEEVATIVERANIEPEKLSRKEVEIAWEFKGRSAAAIRGTSDEWGWKIDDRLCERLLPFRARSLRGMFT